MSSMRTRPVALTIAGSDSGGGAGIQADLKTFTALGVHGTTVVAAVTAQNPREVLGIFPLSPQAVLMQLEAVFRQLPPKAAKTGMLYSADIIRAVADFFQAHSKRVPLVVDPVMLSTSNAQLLVGDAVEALIEELFPLAKLITPNVNEASRLLNQTIGSVRELKEAACELYLKFGTAVLLKGGHLPGGTVTDVLFDGVRMVMMKGTRINVNGTHGTGCTLSAAITAYLAQGVELLEAVRLGRRYLRSALKRGYTAEGHFCLAS